MNFQELISALNDFWANKGCVILPPYDMEVGAGTSSPATMLKCLEHNGGQWNTAYVQGCRRPTDGRYAENPNRSQHYYQYQVIMMPSPSEIQTWCLESLESIGISTSKNDIRFVEDNWANPTLGAWGLGYEVWCNGTEVVQFTYMQELGGVPFKSIPCELTYGLERIAMSIQGIDTMWNLRWNDKGVLYKDIFQRSEIELCKYNFEYANIDILKNNFANACKEAENLVEKKLIYPAYDQCLKAAHAFNLLEARKVLGVTERASYIAIIRDLARHCCNLLMVENNE